MSAGPQGRNLQKIKPVSSESKNLHKQVLEYIFRNSPLVKRSEVVNFFTDLGYSRQYSYIIIKELIANDYIEIKDKWVSLSDKVSSFLKKNRGSFPNKL